MVTPPGTDQDGGVKRGSLKVYLGMAPGVGKTYAMLDEAQRRRARGTDIVVALVETHGRRQTAERLAGLEQLPRRRIDYRGSSFEELDTDAVIRRNPRVVLVDELAHTNIPGCRNEKRWQDVEEILDAGIDVISTVNIQHLESLNDVVARITGVTQRETVPDDVVRRAEQLEIVDISPEALRRRMAHGNIYPAERVDAALSNYFRPGNLTALRELALLWVAERVDEGLQKYRDSHGITDTWEARERIVIGLTGGSEGATVVRRAARIASRSVGAELLAVHVVRPDGLQGADPGALAEQRMLVESLGGTWHQVVGDDIATALLDFARAQNATQLVLGVSRRGSVATLLGGESIEAKLTRMSEHIDVHLVTHERAARRSSWLALPVEALNSPLSLLRRWQGLAIGLIALPLLTWVLSVSGGELNLSSEILFFLLVVIVVAAVGGLWPAMVAAVLAGALLTYFFTSPQYTFVIASADNAIAVVVFILVAVVVAWLVERVVRHGQRAALASAEAATLSGLAGAILRGETSVTALLERVRETFGFEGVALRERPTADARFATVASAGTPPETLDHSVSVGMLHQLVLTDPVTPSAERLLTAFAAQAVVARERERLAASAAHAEQVEEIDRVRTALLNAVSHDLRGPLAAATAAVSSLRSTEVDWTVRDREELLDTAEQSLDLLADLIANLLDMSRLQAGALPVALRRVALGALVPGTLLRLGTTSDRVTIEVLPELPEVWADPAFLERVLTNLVINALHYSPAETRVAVTASAIGERVELRVIDHGPGIPPENRSQVFKPFQRLGDRDNSTGIGLGLALSLGLTEAMAGTLTIEDTPGGGLTMVLSLPTAAGRENTA
ncbi:MAG: sensor histidine kinase KdpD [Propionibacteriaceae bacterium]|nr:sensor histidine kinase KdpD [Propionibacteriaceae bacterium]